MVECSSQKSSNAQNAIIYSTELVGSSPKMIVAKGYFTFQFNNNNNKICLLTQCLKQRGLQTCGVDAIPDFLNGLPKVELSKLGELMLAMWPFGDCSPGTWVRLVAEIPLFFFSSSRSIFLANDSSSGCRIPNSKSPTKPHY